MRKILFGTLLLLITVFSVDQTDTVQAQTSRYESIDIHVTLDEDGNAHFKEHWVADLYKGTENYVVKENLGRSTIEDFTVTEDGEQFEFVKKWNIDASQKEKAFKNGIVKTRQGLFKTKKGVELSWGIGEYGRHEYIVEYTVTNIVKQLKDAQILHWTFSNEGVNIPRSQVSVQIDAPKSLNNEDEKIWAFGYGGDVEFVNGSIIAQSDEQLTIDDYVVLLVEFEDGTFTATDKINKNFKSVQKTAFAGSDYDSGIGSYFRQTFAIIKNSISAVIVFVLLIVGLIFSKKFNQSNQMSQQRRQFRRKYKEEYYRDYPYGGDYLNSYYITYTMGLSSFNTLLTAILLKWINEDKIRMIESTSAILRRKQQTIQFLNDDIDPQSIEGKLFMMIKRQANKEGMLTDRELANWAEGNSSRLRAWERSVMNESKRILYNEDYLDRTEKKILFFKNVNYSLTENGNKMEENVYKYVNYLYDFSLLNEHEAINVKLWDEMMIWAAYLNLTTVVMKQFEKLYPNYIEETKYRDNSLRRTTYFASTVSKSRTKGEQKRRSSGSGGSASRRGGGGSFGGGRGGGVR